MALRTWALGFLLAVVALTRVDGQTVTFSKSDVTSSAGTRGIVAADLNGDGWLDLALANNDPDTVTVLRNGGTAGGFVVSRTTTLGGGPFDITAGDFDRDGRVDLAVANADANAIDVLLTTRTGGLKASRRVAAPGGPRGLTAVDVDRDGRLDIAYTAFSLHAVVVLFGDGAGNLSTRGLPSTMLTNGSRPQGIVGGDFDHDGKTDLAVAETGMRLLSVLSGDGAGRFTRRQHSSTDTLNVVTTGDFDGDGWTDVAAVSTAASSVTFFSGSASGLTNRGKYTVPASPRGIAAADLNVDGRVDVVIGSRDADTVTVLLNAGSWSTFSAIELPAANGSRTVAVGDFDHDGKPDIAAGAEFAGATSLFTNEIALVRGGFAFTRQLIAASQRNVDAAFPASFTAADVNHNGIPDLFTGQVVLLDGRTRKTVRTRTNTIVVGVKVANLNNDGHPDVMIQRAVADPAHQSHFDGVELLMGNGRGDFTWESAQGGMQNPAGLAVGDLNRDGWDDFVVTRRIAFTQTSIEVYLNRRTIPVTFGSAFITETAVFHDMALGDVDADGDLDIVLTFESPTGLHVLTNDGSGAFPIGSERSMSDPGLRLALGDVNEDGLPDAVMLRQTSIGSTLSVGLGEGNGFFGDPVDYPSGLNDGGVALSLALGDLTGDGHLDAFASDGGTEIDPAVSSLAIGRGDGMFNHVERFVFSPSSVTIVDFNRDGLADIVGHDWSNVSILTNRRTTVNRQPLALVDVAGLSDPHPPGTVGSWRYEERLYSDADFVGLNAGSSRDADLHALTYEWRDEAGNILRPERTTPWFDPGILDVGTYRYRLTVRDGRGGVHSILFTLHVLPFKEIVIHVSANGIEQGTWQRFADPTAANGESIGTVNAGLPKVNAPSANPANFVDVYFTPDPSQTYKLWIRGKAQNNSWANDSAWVQFSHAVDAGGNPAYRIGTTSGLPYNLEECSNCGVAGWGWEDDGWGAVNRNGVTLRFTVPSHFERLQWIRVQTREDGLVIDQIVLSAERYLTTRPGSAKNDATILTRTQF